MIDSSVQCSPEKANLMQIFVYGINRKIFRAPRGNLSLKTLALVRLITKGQIESVTRLAVEN